MPLEILLILVVVGISGIALALHLLGLSRVPPLSRDAAQQGWLRQFPEDTPDKITLAQDGKSALIHTHLGHGVVWQFGADTVARYVTGLPVKETATGLEFLLGEYAAPSIQLTLTEEEALAWAQEISAP